MGKRTKRFKTVPDWLLLVEEEERLTRSGDVEVCQIKELKLAKMPFQCVGQLHVQGEGWKFRFRGADARGVVRTWLVPREATGDELLKALSSQGAQTCVERGVGQALLEYARSAIEESHSKIQEATDRMGWHTPPGFEPGDPLDPPFFVFPSGEVVAPTGCEAEPPELLEPPSIAASFKVKGEVSDWVREVTSFVRGQSKGLLALSMAVFAPVARLIPGATGFSLVLTGASSNGKTTWLLVAESFFCKPGAGQFSFNSTGNALEANVRQRRDVVSAIDEITVATADLIGRLGYMANGAGRARADKTGAARVVENFFPVILGTSEASASAKLAEMGKTTTGGQEARLLCPDSGAGADLGAFTTLDLCEVPELEGWRALSSAERLEEANRKHWGAEFSKTLKAAVQRAYGAPCRAWVQWTADNVAELRERVSVEVKAFNAELSALASQRFTGKSLSAVGHRVADRFALLFACLTSETQAFSRGSRLLVCLTRSRVRTRGARLRRRAPCPRARAGWRCSSRRAAPALPTTGHHQGAWAR
jgi:hypothetical protein